MYILLVEDNPTDMQFMQRVLQQKGHEVACFETAMPALECAQQRPPDVLITDYNLARSANGLQLAAEIRRLYFRCVIIVVSASIELEHARQGVRIGIDDLLEKPPKKNLDDFVWGAVMRRKAWLPPLQEENAYYGSDLSLNRDSCVALWKGHDLKLSPMQFAILAALVAKPESMMTYNDLYQIATGSPSPNHNTARRVTKQHILRLRERFNKYDPMGYTHLVSVRGQGYKWSIDGEFDHSADDE